MLKTFYLLLIILHIIFLNVQSCCIRICNNNEISLKICGDNLDIDIFSLKCNKLYQIIHNNILNENIDGNVSLGNVSLGNVSLGNVSVVNISIFKNNYDSKNDSFLNESYITNDTPSSNNMYFSPSPSYFRGVIEPIKETVVIKRINIKTNNSKNISEMVNFTDDIELIIPNNEKENLYYLFFLFIIPFSGILVYFIYKKTRKITILPVIHIDDYLSPEKKTSLGSISPISTKTISISVKDILRPRNLLKQKMLNNFVERKIEESNIYQELREVIEFLITETEKSKM